MQQRVNHTLAGLVRIWDNRSSRCQQLYEFSSVCESVPGHVRRREDYDTLQRDRTLIFKQCVGIWFNATPRELPLAQATCNAENISSIPWSISLPPGHEQEECDNSIAPQANPTWISGFNCGSDFPSYQGRKFPRLSTGSELEGSTPARRRHTVRPKTWFSRSKHRNPGRSQQLIGNREWLRPEVEDFGIWPALRN